MNLLARHCENTGRDPEAVRLDIAQRRAAHARHQEGERRGRGKIMLEALRSLGVQLYLKDGKPMMRQASALTPAMFRLVELHREEIVAALEE